MLRAALPGAVALLLACGGTNNVPAAAATPTFTFSATGVSPHAITVSKGGFVLVQNGDPSGSHQVEPDDLAACPELISGITLPSGGNWDWGPFGNGPKTCGFHDATHTLPSGQPDPAFSATIQVSAP